MCGRYHLRNPKAVSAAVQNLFGIEPKPFAARFNVAPSQFAPILARSADGRIADTPMRWGFIPFWDHSAKPKIAPINARAEEARAKPMFRQAIQSHRCLVPADGFFEWQRTGATTKQPTEIHLEDFRPFFFAGIFSEATEIHPETFLLFTTRPNEIMKPIHNRMPVILEEENAKAWLLADQISETEMTAFSVPLASGKLRTVAVSDLVNNPRNDSPACLSPI